MWHERSARQYEPASSWAPDQCRQISSILETRSTPGSPQKLILNFLESSDHMIAISHAISSHWRLVDINIYMRFGSRPFVAIYLLHVYLLLLAEIWRTDSGQMWNLCYIIISHTFQYWIIPQNASYCTTRTTSRSFFLHYLLASERTDCVVYFRNQDQSTVSSVRCVDRFDAGLQFNASFLYCKQLFRWHHANYVCARPTSDGSSRVHTKKKVLKPEIFQ